MGKEDFFFHFGLERKRGALEKFLHEFLSLQGSLFMAPGEVWKPATDIFETEDGTVVLLEVPGVNKKDVQVVFKENQLTVRAQRRHPYAGKTISFRQMEIFSGPLERSVSLQDPVDPMSIKAHCEDGLLIITIPKKKVSEATPITIKKEEGTERHE